MSFSTFSYRAGESNLDQELGAQTKELANRLTGDRWAHRSFFTQENCYLQVPFSIFMVFNIFSLAHLTPIKPIMYVHEINTTYLISLVLKTFFWIKREGRPIQELGKLSIAFYKHYLYIKIWISRNTGLSASWLSNYGYLITILFLCAAAGDLHTTHCTLHSCSGQFRIFIAGAAPDFISRTGFPQSVGAEQIFAGGFHNQWGLKQISANRVSITGGGWAGRFHKGTGFPQWDCRKYFMFNRDFNQRSSIFHHQCFPFRPGEGWNRTHILDNNCTPSKSDKRSAGLLKNFKTGKIYLGSIPDVGDLIRLSLKSTWMTSAYCSCTGILCTGDPHYVPYTLLLIS